VCAEAAEAVCGCPGRPEPRHELVAQRHRAPERWEYKVDAAESEARQWELDANIERAAESTAPLAEQVEAERARVEELEALLDERHRLLGELTGFGREIREAHTQLRRAERAMERERAGAAEPDVQGERQRRGRNVKLGRSGPAPHPGGRRGFRD
jgi:predicted RNase H-like nuclease (RuvC/YqgF family)